MVPYSLMSNNACLCRLHLPPCKMGTRALPTIIALRVTILFAEKASAKFTFLRSHCSHTPLRGTCHQQAPPISVNAPHATTCPYLSNGPRLYILIANCSLKLKTQTDTKNSSKLQKSSK